MVDPDKSNGYEEIASTFISGRGRNHSGVGASVVADWSQKLPRTPSGNEFHPNPNVRLSQYNDVVIAYLKDHPNRRDEMAFVLVQTALKEAFSKKQ